MKRLTSSRDFLIIKVGAVATTFILGLCAHTLWITRTQLIELWNDLLLYYQD